MNIKKKILIFAGLISLNYSVLADNIILKCIDSKGKIAYVNDRNDEKCKETTIVQDSKKSILNKKNLTNETKIVPDGAISLPKKTFPNGQSSSNETKIDTKEIERLVKQIQSVNDIEKVMNENGL
jgi:hypothetical protein